MVSVATNLRAMRQSAPSGYLTARTVEWFAILLSLAYLAYCLWPIAQAPKLSPDSGTALSISISLARGDPGPLVSTLSPPLQTGTYAVLLSLGLTGIIAAMPALLSMGLAFTLGAMARHFTRSTIASIAVVIVLSFSNVFWEQTGWLTFYPAFALFGYAGLYLGGRYVLEDSGSVDLAFLAALLLAYSLCAFTTALVFLPVPALLLLCFWNRTRVQKTLKLYALIGVFASPWLVWHIWVGGSHFYYHPLNWFTENYLQTVNRDFWHLPHASLAAYLPNMIGVGFRELMPAPLWAVALFGLGSLFATRGVRAGVFAVACIGFFICTLAVIRPAPYARYFYPILPFVTLLGAYGFYSYWEFMKRRPFGRFFMTGVAGVAIVLAALAGFIPSARATYNTKYADRLESSPSYSDMRAIAGIIHDERGVIARDSGMQAVILSNQIHTVFLVSERDYVTYLSWPSDEEVMLVLRKYDIGWILLYKDTERWEKGYNIWLEEAYGVPPRHYTMVEHAPDFRLAFDGKVYRLYQVKP